MNICRMTLYIGILCSLISCSTHSDKKTIQDIVIPTATLQELKKKKDGLLYKNNMNIPYTGVVISTYPSGRIKSKGNIRNGKMVDDYTEYFEGGQVKIKGEYRNGVQEGTWITNHSTGAVALKGQFINGLLQGTWYIYSQNGMLAKKMVYHNGVVTKVLRYQVYKEDRKEKQ
ncbi:MAG: hypothetical protein K2M30_05390 [Desulfovibrionaceae bacterium]|nr:hypothetical protein [Desulfovibrionaceae bacterium]